MIQNDMQKLSKVSDGTKFVSIILVSTYLKISNLDNFVYSFDDLNDQMKFNSILKIFGQLIGFVFLNVKSLKVTQLFTPQKKLYKYAVRYMRENICKLLL